jgi:hypothetical protein
MKYNIDIYKNSEDNSLRYALGTAGTNPLVVIGLNPSTADKEKSDQTITRVMGIADRAKKDSFIMINLYPLRSTSPDNLPKEFNSEYHKTNLEIIDATLKDYQEIDVLVGYGDNIGIRPYLWDCLKDIVQTINQHKVNWYKIGSVTKNGNPRHPSRISNAEDLTAFDIEEYIKNL